MSNEVTDCQQAINLRLAGQSVEDICRTLGRTQARFHQRWRAATLAPPIGQVGRALGPNGLFDLTRASTLSVRW